MLQAANTGLLNPLVPKAHNSECQNPLFPFRIKPVKVDLKLMADFFFAPSALMGVMFDNGIISVVLSTYVRSEHTHCLAG